MFLQVILAVLTGAGASESPLDRAEALLEEFRPREALTALQAVKPPLTHEDHVRLYTIRGIANAYLERTRAAREAFERLLALDPSAALSYTLSPKATFLFEQVREQARAGPPPAVDVRWPSGLETDDEIPLSVEVTSDPLAFFDQAELRYRRPGGEEFETRTLTLREPGRSLAVQLPPVAPNATTPEVLELYLVAKDQKGNEVYRWGSPRSPRRLALGYEAPTPWYARWWFWVIAGSVVAAGAGAAVYATTREPPDQITGTFEVLP